MNRYYIILLAFVVMFIFFKIATSYRKSYLNLEILNIINPINDDDESLLDFNEMSNDNLIKTIQQYVNNPENLSLCLKSTFTMVEKCMDYISSDNIEGDIVEVGVAKGGLGLYMQHLIYQNNYSTKLYLYDTYTGFIENKHMNKLESKLSKMTVRDQDGNGFLDDVKSLFKENDLLQDNVIFVKGDIATTSLNQYPTAISLLYIDVDFYKPTLDTLNNLYHLVSPGGYVFIDDYGVKQFRCNEAVDQFISENNLKINLKKVNQFCYYFQKPFNFVRYNQKRFGIFVNFWALHKKQINNYLPSSAILNKTFNTYRAPIDIINLTNTVSSVVGTHNTVWSIKNNLDGSPVRWEFYWYGHKLGPMDKLIQNMNGSKFINKKGLDNILSALPPKSNKTIELMKEINEKHPIFVISSDVIPGNLNNNDAIQVYTYVNKNITDKPWTCYCFSISNGKISPIVDVMKTYEPTVGNKTEIMIDKYYNVAEYIGVIQKYSKNQIGIYYHCIPIDSFIDFLKEYRYSTDLINFIVNNKERLSNLPFEIAINYSIDNGTYNPVRTAFYGVF